MNKLIISEGGQPVVLEDLKLLQDNDQSLFKQLVKLLTGGIDTFLVSSVSVTTLGAVEGSTAVRVSPGTIYYDGGFYDFEGGDFEIRDGYALNVCLSRQETDMRIFEDEQQRACRETISAYLSPVSEGAYKSFVLDNLSVFSELLRLNVGNVSGVWTPLQVVFGNGYQGVFKFRQLDGDVEFSIDVVTSQKGWSDAPFYYAGWVGTLPQVGPRNSLAGKRTKTYSINNQMHYLMFDEGGNFFIQTDGKDMPDFVQTIQYQWKLTDMIKY